MKKSLIALAALAAVSAASAQSTVTISGGYGLAFGKTTVGSADSGLQIARQTGNLQFAGSEDLGGGLKAGFQLQTSIGAVASTAATASANTLGDRGANVTVGGGFGTVFLGRGNTAIRSLWGAIGDTPLPIVNGISAGTSSASTEPVIAAGDANARVIYGDTFSNYIAYVSPNISGFTASVALAPSQTLTTGVGDNDATKDTTSLTLQYGNGPIAAGVNVTDAAATGGYKITTLLASYDLGVVKAAVTTQSVSLNAGGTNPGNGTVFTASAPLGSGVLAAGFGKRSASTSTSTSFGDDVKQTFVGYKYLFSKRTAVSAVYNKIDRAGDATDVKETHLIVGHTF